MVDNMATPFIIIDGYNLMHAAGFARAHYGPGDLERCRNQFLLFLAQHIAPHQRQRTTVVFDAANSLSDLNQHVRYQKMTIEYAAHHADADALIEELIRETSAPRQTLVISSDHRLHKAAKRRKATPIDSEIFFYQLEEHGPVDTSLEQAPAPQPREIRRKHTGQPTEAETEEWLEIFGDVDVTEKSPTIPIDESGADVPTKKKRRRKPSAAEREADKPESQPIADQDWEQYLEQADADIQQWVDDESKNRRKKY